MIMQEYYRDADGYYQLKRAVKRKGRRLALML